MRFALIGHAFNSDGEHASACEVSDFVVEIEGDTSDSEGARRVRLVEQQGNVVDQVVQLVAEPLTVTFAS